MDNLSIVLLSLITLNILLFFLVVINKKKILNKKYIKPLYIIFILLLIGFSLSFIYINYFKSPIESKDYISNESSSIKEFNINNDIKPEDKKVELKDTLKTTVYDVVSDEFGKNFKYTKDFLLNSDGTYTISLLFDDTNYSKTQCKEFIGKLSNKLKSFRNVGRIEVYFLNNFKIKYSLSIDDFNKGNTSVIIKEDAF